MPFKCLWFCSVLGWVSQGSCPSLISFPTAGCCDESGGPWTLCLCFSYLSIYLSICGPSVCRSCSVIPHIFFGRNCFICLCWFRVSVGEDRFRGFLWCNLRPAFEANFFFFLSIALNSLTNLQWEIIFQRKTHKQVDLTAQYICLLLKLPCGSISCNNNSKEFILWIPVSLIFPCHQEALVY